MKSVARAALLLALLCGVACTGVQRSMMSGTRMDLKHYGDRRIGVLPVSVNPALDSKDLPLKEIQAVVAEEFNDVARTSARSVHAAELANAPEFPLTPQRIATATSPLGLDAAIGITVLGWTAPAGGHMARVNILIAFADVSDPTRKWMLSTTLKAETLPGFTDVLKTALSFQFIDLKYWLKSGLLPWMSDHAKPEGPIVTFYSPSRNTPRHEARVADKALDLVVTGIDDRGITSLKVSNPAAAGYEWKPPEDPSGPAPIFLSAPLTVPLAFGPNVITVAAANAAGHSTVQQIELRSTSARGITFLGVGVEDYENAPDADDADQVVRQVVAAGEPVFSNTPDTLIGSGATMDRILKSLHSASDSLGFGDEVLVMLAGRGGVHGSDLYLALSGGPPRDLRMADLLPLISIQPSLVVMDLCTDAAYLNDSRLALGRALDELERTRLAQTVRIAARMSDCDHGIGELSDAVVKWLRETKPGRAAPRTVAQLYSTLRTDRAALLEAPQPVVAWKASSDGRSRYWAVGWSTTSKDEALAQSQRLRAQGYASEVVLGINGVFGVALGVEESAARANDLLRLARERGQISDTAHVLDADKVKARIE